MLIGNLSAHGSINYQMRACIYIHTSVNSRELQGDLHFADGAIVHAH